MGIVDIKQMSVEERLATMELLWDSLRRGDEEPESPAWHQTVVSARRAKIASGEAKFLSREELRRRFS